MTNYKEFAKQMRENAIKNEQGNIVCSPELWEEITSVIERAIVPPCKVGDKVYILEEKCKYSGEKNEPWNSCKQYWDNVFKNKMWGCMGKDENGNLICCKKKEMAWYVKEIEYSLFLYSNPARVFGENLFLTKKEAEEKLNELNKGE